MKTYLALLLSISLVGLAHAQSGRPQGEVRNFPDIRPSTKTTLPGSSYTPLLNKSVKNTTLAPIRRHVVAPIKRHIARPVTKPTTYYYYYEQPYVPSYYTYTWPEYCWDGWRCRCIDYLFGGY